MGHRIIINHGWVKCNGHLPRSDTVFLGLVFCSICILHLSEAHEADRCLMGSREEVRKGEANCPGQLGKKQNPFRLQLQICGD